MDGALEKGLRPHNPVASLRPRGTWSPFSVPVCLCFFMNGGLTRPLRTPSIKLGTSVPRRTSQPWSPAQPGWKGSVAYTWTGQWPGVPGEPSESRGPRLPLRADPHRAWTATSRFTKAQDPCGNDGVGPGHSRTRGPDTAWRPAKGKQRARPRPQDQDSAAQRHGLLELAAAPGDLACS